MKETIKHIHAMAKKGMVTKPTHHVTHNAKWCKANAVPWLKHCRYPPLLQADRAAFNKEWCSPLWCICLSLWFGFVMMSWNTLSMTQNRSLVSFSSIQGQVRDFWMTSNLVIYLTKHPQDTVNQLLYPVLRKKFRKKEDGQLADGEE